MRKATFLWLVLASALPGRAQEVFVGIDGGEIRAVSKAGEADPLARLSADLVPVTAMAVDGEGRIFIGYSENDGQGWRIARLAPGGAQPVMTLGETPIRALALGGEGEFYVLSNTDDLRALVLRVGPGGGRALLGMSVDPPAAMFSFGGLVRDAGGNIYFSEFGLNRVSKISSAGVVSVHARDLPRPVGLAFDRRGTLFVAGEGGVYRVEPGGAAKLWARHPGPAQGLGLAVDARDNLFATFDGQEHLYKVTPGGVMSQAARDLRNANVVAARPRLEAEAAWGAAGLALAVFAGITLMLLIPFLWGGRRRRGWI